MEQSGCSNGSLPLKTILRLWLASNPTYCTYETLKLHTLALLTEWGSPVQLPVLDNPPKLTIIERGWQVLAIAATINTTPELVAWALRDIEYGYY